MPNAAPVPRRTEMPQIDALVSVECPSCAAAYRVPAARAAKGWMRCSACRHVWAHDGAGADMAGDNPTDAHDATQDMDEPRAAAPSVEEPGLDGSADATDEAMTADEIDALLSDDGPDISAGTVPHDGAREAEDPTEDTEDEASTASSDDGVMAATPADLTDDADAMEDEATPVPLPEDDPAVEPSAETSTESSAENVAESADLADVETDEPTPDGSLTVEHDRDATSLDEADVDAAAPDHTAAPTTPHGRIVPLAARVAAGAVLLAGIGAAISGIAAREAVVRALPRTAVLFEALGKPVNLTPYDLGASDARLAVQGDRDHLSMTVSVRNTSEEPRPLPALDLVLRDADGRAIERSALRVPTELVRGLDTISFKAQVDLGRETDARRVVDAIVALSPPPVQRAALARIQPIGPER